MGREQNQELDQNAALDGAPEASPDEVADIDPAELFDPEEFGVNRRA